MKKTELGPNTFIYPNPALLIGADVDNKANFMTAAWCGIVNSDPPMLSVSIRPQRHTIKGVRQNGTFSVNVPSENQVIETDYCGIYSGARENKNEICGFTVFYGKLSTAPMIEECPVNLACRTIQEIPLGSHIVFIGQIEEVHASDTVLTEGLPDVEKIRPIIFSQGAERVYHGLGQRLGPSHKSGMALKR